MTERRVRAILAEWVVGDGQLATPQVGDELNVGLETSTYEVHTTPTAGDSMDEVDGADPWVYRVVGTVHRDIGPFHGAYLMVGDLALGVNEDLNFADGVRVVAKVMVTVVPPDGDWEHLRRRWRVEAVEEVQPRSHAPGWLLDLSMLSREEQRRSRARVRERVPKQVRPRGLELGR